MANMIQLIDEQGLYEVEGFSLGDHPPFIDSKWFYLGIYSNYFALIAAIYGSFIVIYLSESGKLYILFFLINRIIIHILCFVV